MVTRLTVRPLERFNERLVGVSQCTGKFDPVWLPRCRAVHTFGLRQKLHLLWLDANHRLMRLDLDVRPGSIRRCTGACGVVEISGRHSIPNYKEGHQFKLQGQSLVEAAIVMPVLFLLLFGFIELGLVLHAQQQLTYTAQYATQVGSLTNHDQKITGAVESFYDPTEIELAITNTSALTNQIIPGASRRYNDILAIQLRQPYRLNVPFWPSDAFALTAEGQARVLCQNLNAPHRCD